jgi:hypothetical protein
MMGLREKKGKAMRSITVAAAAILAAAFVSAGAPANARPVNASIVRLGGIAAGAEKYFTVNLQPNAGDVGARAVARYFERFGLSVQASPDRTILFVHGTYGQAAAAGNTSFAAFASMNRRYVGLASPERYPQPIAAYILATTMN